MKNEDIIIISEKLALVPYCHHHVLAYHNWMTCPELLRLTASEPLTLDEEYEMQKTWANDPNKLTFILLDFEKWDRQSSECCSEAQLNSVESDCIFGDVNLFLNGDVAEISIMVALKSYRRKGNAVKVIRNLLPYSRSRLGLKRVLAKIDIDNKASVRLFTDKLGFSETERSEVFNEVTLERNFEAQKDYVVEYKVDNYENFRTCKLNHRDQ